MNYKEKHYYTSHQFIKDMIDKGNTQSEIHQLLIEVWEMKSYDAMTVLENYNKTQKE